MLACNAQVIADHQFHLAETLDCFATINVRKSY